MSRDITPFALRMPPEQRSQIEASAKKSKRSLNSEIIDRLQATLDLDEFMAEYRAGTYSEVYDMLQSVWADNDRMTESGEQTFSTAVGIINSLLDDKLTVLLKLLEREEIKGVPPGQRLTTHEILEYMAKTKNQADEVTLEKRGDTPSPTAKKPMRRINTKRPKSEK